MHSLRAHPRVPPNVAFDLVFTILPFPPHPDDCAAQRSGYLLTLAANFIEAFEASLSRAVGLRSIRLRRQIEQDSPPRWSELVVEDPTLASEIADGVAASDLTSGWSVPGMRALS